MVSITNAQVENTDSNKSIDLVPPIEQMPALIGGMDSLEMRLIYPDSALNNGIEGKVIVVAQIDTLGNPTNIKIIRGIGYGCDEEAIRVLSNSKFTPAMDKGNKIVIGLSIPIRFKLPKN
jgi:protein TonB